MFNLLQEVTITVNVPQYPHLSNAIGVVTASMEANHVGDQRTLYDISIHNDVYFLYEDEILPLYPICGLH